MVRRLVSSLVFSVVLSGCGTSATKEQPGSAKQASPNADAESPSTSAQLFELLPGQRLPRVGAGHPISSGVPIYVSSTELQLNEQRLAELEDGILQRGHVRAHLVLGLFDALTEEADKGKAMAEPTQAGWDGRALLVFDANVQFETVVDVVYTAGRAGFHQYEAIVDTSPELRGIALSPPRYSASVGGARVDTHGEPAGKVLGVIKSTENNLDYRFPQATSETETGGAPPEPEPEPPRSSLHVSIDSEGFHVKGPGQPGGSAPTDIPKLGTGEHDFERLGELAEELHRAHPRLRTATVTAADDVRFQVLMETYASLIGQGCGGPAEASAGPTCRFTELVLEGGPG